MTTDWTTESEAYSPDRFYVRGSDQAGHREEIRVKVAPDLADALAKIVQSKSIPEYSTIQDIVRDAIVHRLHYLHQSGMVNGVESALRRQMAIESMVQYEEWASKFSTTIMRLADQVRSLLREKDPDATAEAERIVRNAYAEASCMTDAPYWRKKYMSFLESEFGDLLKE